MATVALYRTILLLALPCQKRLTSKIAYNNVTPKDCVSLKKSLEALPAVKQLVSVCRSKILKDIFVGHGDSCKKRIKISAITIFRNDLQKKTQTVAFVTNSINLIINYCAITWHRLF
ncbi:MAG TPA: hypothetical protein IAC95_03485 [Candidatus Fimimonas gallinarum]|uniref:Uncharacterized protein n=1 Tax=Candidatus Fimimonas gallinarum TaxID=2840821 RepID=A0A9D1J7S5_9BACT|nr:hypothetical protein [Candidatus Fimimonas gallinarum]